MIIDSDNDTNVDDTLIAANGNDGIILSYQGTEYNSCNTATSIIIEENGPLKAVLKVKGYFENPANGNKVIPPNGDNGLSYTLRFKVFKDNSYIKLDYTFENENQGGAYTQSDPAHVIDLDYCKLKATLSGMEQNKTAAFDSYTDNFSSANYELLQNEISDYSTQDYDFQYTIKKNTSTTVNSGTKYNSYIDLHDSNKGLMLSSRWFWQNFPMGYSIEGNSVIFNMLPGINGQTHRVLGGLWKTHELILYFHGSDNDFSDEVAVLKQRLIARCSDTHYANSEFFMHMIPSDLNFDYTFPAGEKYQSAINHYDSCHRAKFDESFIT